MSDVETPDSVRQIPSDIQQGPGAMVAEVACPTCQMGMHHIIMSGAYDQNPERDDERFVVTGQAVVAAGGVGTIELPPIPPGQDWRIERVTFNCDGAAASTATVRVDSALDPTAIIMSTLTGNLAVVENTQPVYARAYQRLYVVWAAATVASNVYVRIQYALREGDPVKEY